MNLEMINLDLNVMLMVVERYLSLVGVRFIMVEVADIAMVYK